MATKRITRSQVHNEDKEPRHFVELDDIESDHTFPPMHIHYDSASSQSENDGRGSSYERPNLDGDRVNIAVLMFLYVLQGIPLGLAGSIPLMLQERNISYKEQAVFSFVIWPFSMKLLWAPIVDAAYVKSFGRRKSWLIPTQYALGLFMLYLSTIVKSLLGEAGNGHADVYTLTFFFACLTFLAATQDVAVDGWALTMLSRRNVGWASTCNSVGQTVGYFVANVCFLALQSPAFCNYLRTEPQPYGLVDLSWFLRFWGFVFLITTSLVWWLKHERMDDDSDELGIVDTYKQLYHIIRLPAVLKYVAILLTIKIGFAATDAVTGLKLIGQGVPKEHLAMLAVPLVPLQVVLTLYLSHKTAGPKPLDVTIKAFPVRLVMGLVFATLVWWAGHAKTGEHQFPYHFYIIIVLCYCIHQVTLYSCFVSNMAFVAKISDPAIGGTYMTLMNTVTNLGGNWPATMALWFVDGLTWTTCEGASGTCYSESGKAACAKDGGRCVTQWDGYYIEVVVCTVLGFLWLGYFGNRMRSLQDLDPKMWRATTS